MRFIADSMLGRLARWLRLLGYDTLYFPHIEDSAILRIAREDKRTLLTRDTRLVKVRGLQHFLLLEENNPFKQLKNVVETFKLKTCNKESEEGTVILSRCIICNSVLNIVQRDDVKNAVPEYVYQTSDIFKKCTKCGKLYWKGTHSDKFIRKLSEIFHN